jgi:hypothetical protein
MQRGVRLNSKRKFGIILIVALTVGGGGCSFDPNLPAPAEIGCSVASECPAGQICTPLPSQPKRLVCCRTTACDEIAVAVPSPEMPDAGAMVPIDGVNPGPEAGVPDEDGSAGQGGDDGAAGGNGGSGSGPVGDPAGKTLGMPCAAGAECVSGLCVDGVCCNTACDKGCQACDLAGNPGTCGARSGAPRPDKCAAKDIACAATCDGTSEECSYPTATTQCGAPSCAAGVATLRAGCDGKGACQMAQTTVCAPYPCADATACAGGCSAAAPCQPGSYCEAGRCVPTAANGQPCGTDPQCASGKCVDSICCDTPCKGSCESCAQAGKLGTCSPISGKTCRAAMGACDAAEVCDGASPDCPADKVAAAGASCRGAMGACDVAETCDGSAKICPADKFKAAGTTCGNGGSCAGTMFTPAAVCSGNSGGCRAGAAENCGTYACAVTGCKKPCGTAADCVAKHYCSGGVCMPTLADGMPCTEGIQCAAGTCTPFFTDADGDGYYPNGAETKRFCGTAPPKGYATKQGDCCDADPRAHPGGGFQPTPMMDSSKCGFNNFDFDCNTTINKSPEMYYFSDHCVWTKPCGSCGAGCSIAGSVGALRPTPNCGQTYPELKCTQTAPGMCMATTLNPTVKCK